MRGRFVLIFLLVAGLVGSSCGKDTASGRDAGATPGGARSGLAPKNEIKKSDRGYILYTHYDVERMPADLVRAGLPAEVPVPRIYSMAADGKNQQPFIVAPNFAETRQVSFSPDYRSIVFTSNHEAARSACFTDVFQLELATGKTARLSGSEWSAGAVKGRGTVYGVIQLGETQVAPSAVNIAVQGMNGEIFKLRGEVADAQGRVRPGQYSYVIENVPAGKVWVKCWHSRHKGDVKFVDVLANQQNIVETMHMPNGNYLVTNPTVSPDGRIAAVLSQHAFFVNAPPGNVNDPKGVPEQGFDTVNLLDLKDGGKSVFMWEPTKMRGMSSKDPKLSPDGKTVAFIAGQAPAESLVVASVESMLRGRPDVKTVVAGQQALGVGAVACGTPAWSPDGRKLAFVRVQSDLNLNFMGNLCVVDLATGKAGQITNVQANQCVANPCWSPDGAQLAASLITSKRNTMNVLDLLTLNVTSDIWSLNVDGTEPRQLTRDGRSGEPAWGK